MLSCKEAHSFLGIDMNGCASIINTNGNKYTCIVLRGDCVNGSNFHKCDIDETTNLLEVNGLNKGIIIDASHDNTLINMKKDYTKQINNVKYITENWAKNSIVGVMIESNINEGKQSIEDKPLKKGISITDGCINLEDTYELLNFMDESLNK